MKKEGRYCCSVEAMFGASRNQLAGRFWTSTDLQQHVKQFTIVFPVHHSFQFSIFKTVSVTSPFLRNPLLQVPTIIYTFSANTHLFTSQALLGNPLSMVATFGSTQYTVASSASLSLCNCACDYCNVAI